MTSAKAQDTQAKLLAAAHDEFSAYGLAGGRVDRIDERSGVNKQRVYAYFASKEALFSAVLSRAFAHLAEQVPIPTTKQGLRTYVGDVFDYHRANGDLVRLLAWEGLHYRDEPLPGEGERREYYLSKITALSQALGVVDAGTASRTLISLIGLATYPFVVPQTTRFLMCLDGDTDAGWALLRSSIVAQSEAIIDRVLQQVTDKPTN